MAIPTAKAFQEAYDAQRRDAPRRIIAMLGMWVSELEPVVVGYLPGIPVGLTAEGHNRLYVRYEDTRRNRP